MESPQLFWIGFLIFIIAFWIGRVYFPVIPSHFSDQRWLLRNQVEIDLTKPSLLQSQNIVNQPLFDNCDTLSLIHTYLSILQKVAQTETWNDQDFLVLKWLLSTSFSLSSSSPSPPSSFNKNNQSSITIDQDVLSNLVHWYEWSKTNKQDLLKQEQEREREQVGQTKEPFGGILRSTLFQWPSWSNILYRIRRQRWTFVDLFMNWFLSSSPLLPTESIQSSRLSSLTKMLQHSKSRLPARRWMVVEGEIKTGAAERPWHESPQCSIKCQRLKDGQDDDIITNGTKKNQNISFEIEFESFNTNVWTAEHQQQLGELVSIYLFNTFTPHFLPNETSWKDLQHSYDTIMYPHTMKYTCKGVVVADKPPQYPPLGTWLAFILDTIYHLKINLCVDLLSSKNATSDKPAEEEEEDEEEEAPENWKSFLFNPLSNMFHHSNIGFHIQGQVDSSWMSLLKLFYNDGGGGGIVTSCSRILQFRKIFDAWPKVYATMEQKNTGFMKMVSDILFTLFPSINVTTLYTNHSSQQAQSINEPTDWMVKNIKHMSIRCHHLVPNILFEYHMKNPFV
jgi:hypothetical protein